MNQTRLILCGGFLGAGKTTLIWDVAQRLMAQGKRVGLVTNDQAPELVDSRLLKQSGLQVAEVAGSCFCCNFNGFVDAIHSLRHDVQADVILAEPVGSCADLTATIVRHPLGLFGLHYPLCSYAQSVSHLSLRSLCGHLPFGR